MSAVLSAVPLKAAAEFGAMVADQEFAFGQADFDRVRQLIYQRAGISLHAGKQAMVYSRLSRRLRETGHRSVADYLQALEQPGNPSADREWQEFVNCLTTNLTSFFREEHHFHELARDLKAKPARPLRIWCSAASTGEEPYSIAMTAAEAGDAARGVTILASDIDTRVLATAARGVYPADSRGLSPERSNTASSGSLAHVERAANLFGLVQGKRNAIAPGKRPLSSMSPSIITKDGRTFMVLGSPGGSRIITTLVEVISNIVDHGMTIQEAVNAPRFHHQWQPDVISVEQGFSPATIKLLERKGHKVEPGDYWSDGECIMIDPKNGERLGASDKRNNGKAIGF